MATDITVTRAGTTPKRLTLSATPSQCLKVTFPDFIKYVSVKFPAAAGQFATAGTDSGSIDADYIDCAANFMLSNIFLHPSDAVSGKHAIYLASTTASAKVELLLSRGL